MKRSRTDLIEGIKRLAATYPDAPRDLRGYTWLEAPRYWESLAVPGAPDAQVRPQHEDRHGGVAFRVGWDERERVAVFWLL